MKNENLIDTAFFIWLGTICILFINIVVQALYQNARAIQIAKDEASNET